MLLLLLKLDILNQSESYLNTPLSWSQGSLPTSSDHKSGETLHFRAPCLDKLSMRLPKAQGRTFPCVVSFEAQGSVLAHIQTHQSRFRANLSSSASQIRAPLICTEG